MNNARRRNLVLTGILAIALAPCAAMAQTTMDPAVDAARIVLDEIMSVPASQIPQALLADARGVAIIPSVVKGGFIVGVRHGRGVVLVRDDAGNWHPPVFIALTGGSVGWQAGLQSTDVVLVFRSRKSIDGLMNGKLTIGVDAAAAAGPVGREASVATDERLRAEILSYSRSRGLFAGVSIDGSMIQIDRAAGSAYYRTPIVGANGEAIRPRDTAPDSAIRLMNRLATYSGAAQIETREEMLQLGSSAAAAAVPRVDAVRQQLTAAWHRLSARLDDNWRAYLAPPAEVLTGQPVDATALRNKLQQYAVVAADQKYAALTQSLEFESAHQLLHEYADLQATQSATKLTLPPPPTRTN
jgi:SH3 domain-containing YSC84-like protein 1